MNFYVEIQEIDKDFDLWYSIIIMCFFKAFMQQFNLLPLYPPSSRDLFLLPPLKSGKKEEVWYAFSNQSFKTL